MLPNGKTRYSIGMLKGKMKECKYLDGTKTIFIKRSKTNKKIEKSWIGTTSCFEVGEYKNQKAIYFKVNLEKEIDCPEAYRSYPEGWYLVEELAADEDLFSPPFLSKLKTTNDWEEFERLTLCLFIILGIHDLYRFHPRNQKGKADGFFVFRNTVIFYDCTLEKNFEESKKVQMENFCGQLRNDHIEYQKKKFTIRNTHKRVWIVTNGLQRLIREVDEIKIKEVPVQALINLYRKRISQTLDSEAFERELLVI